MGEDVIAERLRTVALRWLVPAGVCVAVLLLVATVIGVPAPVRSVGSVAIGLFLGTMVSAGLHLDRLRVTISAREVRIQGGEADHTFPRATIHAVFVEDGDLVVLGPDTGERLRVSSTLAEPDLAAAFTRHGYPWQDGDPFIDQYRKWTPATDGLPAGADELLRERATKIGKWDLTPANELRNRLAALGVVVRDDGRRQFWRVTG